MDYPNETARKESRERMAEREAIEAAERAVQEAEYRRALPLHRQLQGTRKQRRTMAAQVRKMNKRGEA